MQNLYNFLTACPYSCELRTSKCQQVCGCKWQQLHVWKQCIVLLCCGFFLGQPAEFHLFVIWSLVKHRRHLLQRYWPEYRMLFMFKYFSSRASDLLSARKSNKFSKGSICHLKLLWTIFALFVNSIMKVRNRLQAASRAELFWIFVKRWFWKRKSKCSAGMNCQPITVCFNHLPLGWPSPQNSWIGGNFLSGVAHAVIFYNTANVFQEKVYFSCLHDICRH